jgi:glycosyltransferase involved in cell wall biosynthesis
MKAVILSYALDTNGQNERFVRASERFGTDPKVLKALAIGKDDPAGVVARYAIAAAKGDTLEIRSVHRVSHYFEFPADIVWTKKNEPLIRQLIDDADVIHLNNSYRPIQRFGNVRKPTLLHHHGSLFRNNPAHMLGLARSRRMVQAVSTLDLTRFAPDELHWLPTAYDVTELNRFAKRRDVLKGRIRPDGRFRVVHAPTNRSLKATDRLIAAVGSLQAEGLPIDLVIVEGQAWRDCLAVKATADVVFDQTLWGYGCNAVEAWAMGVPVVAGADDYTLGRMRKEFGELPFYLTTDDSIADSLSELYESKDLRAEYAEKGLAHVRRYHDEKPALERLAELYGLAIKTYTAAYTSAADAVRFRNAGSTIRIDGQVIPRGEMETTDPIVISRLRALAKRRQRFRVEEVAG